LPEKIGQLNEQLALYGPAILFYGIAALVIAAAAYAVWAKKIDHSAFSLMACFSGVAAVYALLGSDFLAVTQLIVYVGGIMILIVFGVLLTDRLPVEFRQIQRETVFQGLFVAVPVLVALLWAVLGTRWPSTPGPLLPPAPGGTTEGIGRMLLTDYLFPFEFASLLLLVALVGAARLARGGRK
jgi:NADH:ubiquinone oxidoreductase subunit 6 (subunit J)